MIAAACVVLSIGCVAYVFWPQRSYVAKHQKTRLEYLRERREVIYENLRDLNFEHKAGKIPEQDFESLRDSLETEAAGVLSEIAQLERAN